MLGDTLFWGEQAAGRNPFRSGLFGRGAQFHPGVRPVAMMLFAVPYPLGEAGWRFLPLQVLFHLAVDHR